MAKKKVKATKVIPEVEEVLFEDFPIEEQGELLAAGDALEELKEQEKPTDFGRVKVSVVRAFIYKLPDPLSRSIAPVSFGNLLTLLEERDYSEKFFKVRVPRSGESIDGFVLKTKVKRI